MIPAEKKARQLSRLYYNYGLDRAQIRDLSGAIDKLRISLQFDKKNVQARNLLGLVYFESGEVVAALSEWVISKNISPKENIASDFIDRVQADQNKLHAINLSIKRYNEALQSCRDGEDDVAAVALRRVIFQNPKLLKAYHLLALLEIKNRQFGRARRILRRAAKIDRTNPTTLRFLKEVDEQTGRQTLLDGREKKSESDDQVLNQPSGQIIRFRETSSAVNLVNILIGLGIGLLAAAFLVAPAVRQGAGRESAEKIQEYSNTLADQKNEIDKLQAELDKLNGQISSNEAEQTETQQTVADQYLNLLLAYQAYQSGDAMTAGDKLNTVDENALNEEAKGIYNTLYNEAMEDAYTAYLNNGSYAYYQGDYDKAISLLEKAQDIHGDEYDVMQYLALSYQAAGEYDAARELFQKIVDTFPGTRRAQNAEYSLTLIDQTGAATQTGGTSDTQENTGTAGTDQASGTQGNAGTGAETGNTANAG